MVSLVSLGSIGGTTHTIVLILLWVFIIIAIGLGGWFLWWVTRYKVQFTIRKITNNRTVVIGDKARIIRKKDGSVKWRLKKIKQFVPVPPSKAIDITTKGKYHVEAYYTEQGEWVYITDELKGQVGSRFPIQAVDKEFYANQSVEGNKYKSKNWKDMLIQAAPIMAIIMILIIFMVFFDRTVQPTIELSGSLVNVAKELSAAAQTLQSCSQNVVIPT